MSAQLGLGTAGIGNLYTRVSEATARETVTAALAGGMTLFDTAPHYGFGLAERRLGEALDASAQGRAARISTKVGRLLRPTTATGLRHGFMDADPFEPHFDYSADAIHASFASSLTRLRRSRVDVLLAHDLGAMTHGDAAPEAMRAFLGGGYRAMRDLRDSGAAGAIGVGVNEVAVCLELLAEVELDVILLAGRYTLLEQAALEDLLPLCAAKGVRLIIGGPFNSGILADGPAQYNYAPAPEPVLARASALRAACAAHGVALPSAALAFPAAHPAVMAVVAGLVGAEQVEQALAAWRQPPPAALWADLARQGLIAAQAPLPLVDATLS
jgi:D-threo-aldose 1-dehydrogenase